MRIYILIAALCLTACASAPQTQRDIYADVLDENLRQARSGSSAQTPYKVAAGNDTLALRATPSASVVTETYEFVHTSDYADIEARLRDEIPGTTRRLYNSNDGVRVKYTDANNVWYWSAATGQIRKGRWEITEGTFGPQICETFYGDTTCLNTVEQLSGVGVIDTRKGDAFDLESGGRPVTGTDGLPAW